MEAIILKFREDGLDEVTESILRTVNRLKALESSLAATRRAMQMVTQSKLDNKLNRIGIAAANATDKLSKLNAQMVVLSSQSVGNPRAIVPNVARTASNAIRSGNSRLPVVNGPYSRLAARQSQLQAAIASGDPTAILDAQFNMAQAQKSLQRSLPKPPLPPKAQPGFASNLGRLVMSTRVGNGSVMPLVGNIARLFGVSSAGMGQIALRLLPLLVMQQAFKFGMSRAGEINAGAGASFSGASSIKGMSNALGFDPLQGPNGFQGAIQSGAARSFAIKAGINPYYNEMTGAGGNFAEKMGQFIRVYGDPNRTNNREALAAARAVGLEQQIGLSRNASANVRELVFNRAARNNPLSRQLAADTGMLANGAMAEFNRMMDNLATYILPGLNGGLKPFVGFMQSLNNFFEKGESGWMKTLKDLWVIPDRPLPIERILNALSDLLDPGGKQKREREAAQNLNKASEKLVEAAEAFKDGTYGSANVNGIVPAGVRGAVQNGDANAARYYANQGLPLI